MSRQPARRPLPRNARHPGQGRSHYPGRRPVRRRRRDTPGQAMTRFLVSFLLALAVFLPLGVWVGKSLQGSGELLTRPAPSPTAAPTPEPVDMTGLNSPHAILLRRGGPVLGEVGADDPIYPASLTKMMTVLLAAETLTDLDAQVTMAEDLYPPLWEANASMAGFQPGETVTVRDLLYGALLPSGAECCSALARQVCDTEQDFVARMNARAAELGMDGTHFCNVTGLQDPQHQSTVADLARLLDAALDNDTFRTVFTTRQYFVPPTNLHPDGITLTSSMFDGLTDTQPAGVELLGGKTGFTDEAGLCLASLARCGDSEYILVTAGAPGDNHSETLHLEDAVTVYTRLAASIAG